MARQVTTVLSLRDNYTAVIKKATKYTKQFNTDVKKQVQQLEAASKKKHAIRINNSAAMRALSAIEAKTKPLRKIAVNVAARVQQFQSAMKPVYSAANKVLNKTWTVTLKLKDAVTSGLKKITGALKQAAKIVLMGGSAALAASGYALKQGMELERYEVSMKHFVGVNNPAASESDVQKQTNQYLDWLRNNANATPFGTGEVIQAGSRAVQVAGGNTNAAQGLVKMAENMAALTPGKTIMDAMEALADAQMGEMERMKEFGFKMTADAFKAAGDDLFSTKSTTGKTLEEVFSGGAEKLAQTGSGLLSTITGKLQSGVQNAGRTMLDSLKPLLQSMIPMVDQLVPKIEAMGVWAAGAIQKLIPWLKEAYGWLKDKLSIAIDWVKQKIKRLDPFIQFLKKAFQGMDKSSKGILASICKAIDAVANTIIDAMNWVADNWSTIEPILSAIAGAIPVILAIAAGLKVLSVVMSVVNAVMAASPVTWITLAIIALIAGIVLLIKNWDKVAAAGKAAWAWICQAWQNAAAWFDTNVIQPIVSFFSGLWSGICAAADNTWNWIVTAWENAGAWFNDTIVAPVACFFSGLWTGISTAATTAWTTVSTAFSNASTWFNETVVQPVAGFFTGLWDGITTAATNAWTSVSTAFSTAATWFDTSVVQPVAGFFTGLCDAISTAATTAWTAVSELWTAATTWFSESIVLPIAQGFSGLWSGISTAATNTWTAISDAWNGVATWFADTVINPVVSSITGIWDSITGAFGSLSTWFDEHVWTPIKSVIPQWLINLFGGGSANATVTVRDERGTPHAAGIKRIPYDNYPALLHKGEAVLPTGEADAFRSAGNSKTSAPVINLTVNVNGANMDENRLASLLVNRLSEVALNM